MLCHRCHWTINMSIPVKYFKTGPQFISGSFEKNMFINIDKKYRYKIPHVGYVCTSHISLDVCKWTIVWSHWRLLVMQPLLWMGCSRAACIPMSDDTSHGGSYNVHLFCREFALCYRHLPAHFSWPSKHGFWFQLTTFCGHKLGQTDQNVHRDLLGNKLTKKVNMAFGVIK